MNPVHPHTLRLPVLIPAQPFCADCVGRLREAVEGLPGVDSVEFDRRTATLTVMHDPTVVTEEGVEREARRLGLEISESVAHAAYRLTGLD